MAASVRQNERRELAQRVRFTRHARERMEQMSATEDEVRSAIAHPIESGVSRDGNHNSMMYRGRRVCACVADDAVVITVIWTEPDTSDYLQPERRKWTR